MKEDDFLSQGTRPTYLRLREQNRPSDVLEAMAGRPTSYHLAAWAIERASDRYALPITTVQRAELGVIKGR